VRDADLDKQNKSCDTIQRYRRKDAW